MSLLIRLQNKKIYWQIRNLFLRIIFFSKKLIFKGSLEIENTKDNISMSYTLILLNLKSILYSVIIVMVILKFEVYLISKFPQKFIWLSEIKVYLLDNSSSYENFLVSIISVLGVFLGLYFTAISIVASSIFAQFPSNIRELLLKEKVGNIYILMLSGLLSISIISLGLRIFNVTPVVLLTLLILFFSCVSIFGFVMLGLRVFFFFDLSQLTNAIFRDLKKNINSITIKGVNWNDINFQMHYQKLAQQNISTLKDLIDICNNTKYLEKKPLTIILLKTCLFLKDYQNAKSSIPQNSFWFTRIPKYNDTFLVSPAALNIALQCRTPIQPKFVPDIYWLEDDIIDILISTISSVLTKENYAIARKFFDAFNKYLETLGNDLDVEKCLTICSKFDLIIEEHFLELPEKSTSFYDKNIMAFFDICSLSILSCLVGFNNLLRNFNLLALESIINSIDWNNKKNIYKKDFFPIFLERMEFLQLRLSFEYKSEGRIITPLWYRNQLVFSKYEELFHKSIYTLLNRIEEYFSGGSKKFFQKKNFILAAWRLKKGLESIVKLTAQYSKLKEIVEKLEKIHVEKDLTRPKWDWANLEERINNNNSKLIAKLAKCITFLSQMEPNDRYPDLFGETYHVLCQECFISLLNNETKNFKSIFPFLLIASFQAHERLKKSLKNFVKESVLLCSIEPLLDIMELSGYALIYSELYNNPSLWTYCQEVWNSYLNDCKDMKNERIKSIIFFYKYRALKFNIFSRDLWKTDWKLKLNNKLREMKLIGSMFFDEKQMRKKTQTHPSSFIRALCFQNYEPLISASEIFILTYLLEQYHGPKIDFEDRYDFVNRLKKEKMDDVKKKQH